MNLFATARNWLTDTLIKQLPAVGSETVGFPALPPPAGRPDFLALIREHGHQLIFWSGAAILVIAVVFFVSVTRKLESWLDPLLHRIKKFAPFVMQITLGVVLILSVAHGAVFGVELPLLAAFGQSAGLITGAMYATGAMLMFGIFPRIAASVVVLLFIPIALAQPGQLLHHATYLGEGVTILLFGGGYELVRAHSEAVLSLERSLELHLHKYKFVLLRIAFGVSVIVGSFYTRFVHGGALLEQMTGSSLTQLLNLDPGFLLLGLLLVEVTLGIFFIIGFEIRFAAICYGLLLLLSMSLLGDAVWAHITLLGTAIAMFTHGYDRYTVGGRFFQRGNLEPVL